MVMLCFTACILITLPAFACNGGGGGNPSSDSDSFVDGPPAPPKNQAKDMDEGKKWRDEGDYYEDMENKGETIQTGVNIAGNVVDYFTRGAGSKINSIGQTSAIFIQTFFESKNKGKSETQALDDAFSASGRNISKINTLEKIDTLKEILKRTPNIKAPPAMDPGISPPDHSFGAGGPAPLNESVFDL